MGEAIPLQAAILPHCDFMNQHLSFPERVPLAHQQKQHHCWNTQPLKKRSVCQTKQNLVSFAWVISGWARLLVFASDLAVHEPPVPFLGLHATKIHDPRYPSPTLGGHSVSTLFSAETSKKWIEVMYHPACRTSGPLSSSPSWISFPLKFTSHHVENPRLEQFPYWTRVSGGL